MQKDNFVNSVESEEVAHNELPHLDLYYYLLAFIFS